MEANAGDRDQIAEKMALSPDNFLPERQPFTATQQAVNYHRLLLHILAEAETLGFELGVIVAGHYPLIDHARAAVLQFNQGRYNKYHGMLAWAFVDYLLIKKQYPEAGDHAGIWETSHMLAIDPKTVNLKLLPKKKKDLVGIMSGKHPRLSNAKYGRKTMEASVNEAVKQAKARLKDRWKYSGHGNSLRED